MTRFAGSLLLLLLAACGGGGGGGGTAAAPTPTPTASPSPSPTATASPPSVASTEREVTQQTADPAVPGKLAVNVAINPATASGPKGRPFVMLTGAGGVPRNGRLILREGALGMEAFGAAAEFDGLTPMPGRRTCC